MKWYNGVMGLLTILCVGIVLFVLTGCANTQQVKEAKDEQAFRNEVMKMKKGNDRDDLLLETVEERSYYEEVIRCENFVSTIKRETYKEKYGVDLESDCEIVKAQRIKPTPITVSKEWADQWPSLREETNE